MKTVRVKILIAIDENGKWVSAGYEGNAHPKDWIALDDLAESFSWHWVEVDVPVPEPITFEGTLSNVGKSDE